MFDSEKSILLIIVSMYKDRPHLWNRNHKDYKNRELRQESNKLLLEVYKEFDPLFTVKHLVKKIQNLRTFFFKEYKKVQTSIRNGDEKVYEPTLWYYDAMSFLACGSSNLDTNKTENTNSLEFTLQSDNEDNFSTSSHKNKPIHEPKIVPIPVDEPMHKPINELKDVPIHEPIQVTIPIQVPIPIQKPIHVSKPTHEPTREPIREPIHEPIRETIYFTSMIKKPRLMKVVKKEIDDTFSMPRESRITNENNREEENECDLYAQLLARKLKKVKEDQRLVLMNEIDNLVFKAIMASKTRNSDVFFTMVDPNMDEEF